MEVKDNLLLPDDNEYLVWMEGEQNEIKRCPI